MKLKIGLLCTVIAIIAVSAITALYLSNHDVSLLQPKGKIAQEQYNLLVFACVLSLVVILPVFTMLIAFAWRYRASNTKAAYKPDWDSSKTAESIWWGIPILLIVILSVVTWRSTHALDPYKPIESQTPAVNVQVVALQWKWLFIYPDYGIATVNYVQIPEDTPIAFTITADAPMNSFWIPDLGGQVYAMAGMQTKLHLMADDPGTFRGVSANISGEGFAKMHFNTEAVNKDAFKAWVASERQSGSVLTQQTYAELAKPSTIDNPLTFSEVDPDLYSTIIHSYMGHTVNTETSDQNAAASHQHNHEEHN